MDAVTYALEGPVAVVTLSRPERRNAVDGATSQLLYDAFKRFDADEAASVAVFTGAGGHFCGGADLKAIAGGQRGNRVTIADDFGPMGPTRLELSKPVIAAIEGPAVAGGMELAAWCDLRVAGRSSFFGMYNRRFGVPTCDLGGIRFSRIIGHGRAINKVAFSGRIARRALKPGRYRATFTAIDAAGASPSQQLRFTITSR